MSLLVKIFGDPNEKELKKLKSQVDEINSWEPKLEKLNDSELKAQTGQLKEYLSQGKKEDDILPQAFALVREAGKRSLKQRHFDVQLTGGIALHQGKIAEMRTGEGKTLAATCPAYLNALNGKGVHIITVNDYLSKRDCVWMGQIYNALGLSVACIVHDAAYVYDEKYIGQNQIRQPADENQNENPKLKIKEIDKERDEMGSFKVVEDYLRPCSRKDAYLADITYGTNNEYGFDYLRDNLVHRPEEMAQRKLHYAIIDEIDSILIDEARTPLIISSPAEESAALYYKLARLVDNLKSNEDYVMDEKMRAATLTEKGMDRMAELLGEDPWTNNNVVLIHHIDAALKAKTIFHKDRDYVIKSSSTGEKEVIIIDEFTGRLMLGRRYSEGIHQAIEAKENVQIKQESKTLATITFQNYFRFYEKLSGMTGTALTEAEEFHKIYNLEVLVVPTNKPMIRKDLADRIYRTKEAKFKAIVEEIKQRHTQGQPILIGTGGFAIGEQTVGAIEKNRIIRDFLAKEGIGCQVLDATNHEKEGEIIAQAGRLGAVTIATNMAGRGVDIILGGNPPDKEEQRKILELGGLHIIGTERHEARRIDNQLRGRSGRQGDPGSSQFFLSLEDDLMKIFGGARLSSLMTTLRIPEEMPIESKAVSRAIEAAQRKVEGFNFDTRKHLLEYDDVLNKHREAIYCWRRSILEMTDQEIKKEILRLTKEELKKTVSFNFTREKEYLEKLKEMIKMIFPLTLEMEDDLQNVLEKKENKTDLVLQEEIIKHLEKTTLQAYEQASENIKQINKDWGDQESDKDSLMSKMAKSILLQSIDHYWIYHLEMIDNLKGGIGLRAYGQQDPLVEYKKESRGKYSQLIEMINKQVVYSIYKIGGISVPQPKKEMKLKGADKGGQSQEVFLRPKGEKKVGRNDPCPCGSGKKYKHCCGK
ncbi:MAG: preprotein translocase subunit SecA [Patescibacteria group bacterium]|nr:preprotein translocase subunit SecA [Patescibacteria group bacterium]